MPVYEYQCKNGHRVEEIRSLAEFTEEVVCQVCRKEYRRNKAYSESLAKLVPSRTGTPVLKRGIGGFHKPTRD